MKNAKKLLAIILSVVMIASTALVSFAFDTTAQLLNIYADGMLFLQNSEAIISGTGTPGNKITLTLTDSKNNSVTTSEAIVLSDGTFNITFNTPAGSFDEYTIIIQENDKIFDTLENIVFGELWLASGQSNMQYPLAQS